MWRSLPVLLLRICTVLLSELKSPHWSRHNSPYRAPVSRAPRTRSLNSGVHALTRRSHSAIVRQRLRDRSTFLNGSTLRHAESDATFPSLNARFSAAFKMVSTLFAEVLRLRIRSGSTSIPANL